VAADRSILVVDDEADLVANYYRLLRRRGYRVISAGSRADGLTLVEREPLSLLITDLKLPDGDGLDLVRAAREASSPMPSIVVTGFAPEASRAAAFAAGASAYLGKPFAMAAFMSVVEQTLGQPRP
jgi:two-component system, NtrC family, response regulator PilR